MDLSWMAWTLPTAAFFITIFLMLVGMGVWEYFRPAAIRASVSSTSNDPGR